jgi:hypothetical protein
MVRVPDEEDGVEPPSEVHGLAVEPELAVGADWLGGFSKEEEAAVADVEAEEKEEEEAKAAHEELERIGGNAEVAGQRLRLGGRPPGASRGRSCCGRLCLHQGRAGRAARTRGRL